MIEAFKFGFSTGRRQWKIAAMVYFFQLCLAVTLGLQVLDVFESSIGNSLEINKLLQNYDHSVITDFLKIHGASITPLIGQLRWLILVYVLFAVFIDAGLLTCAGKPFDATASDFWQGGAAHFFPFFKIALVFFGLAAVWAALIFVPSGLYLQPALVYFPNEKYGVWGAVLLVLIFLLGLSVLFLWSVSSRFWKIGKGGPIAASLKNGWRVFQKNKGRLWGLLALFLGLQITLVAVYWLLEMYLGMTSVGLIIFMAVVQQMFSFCRVLIRQMIYAGMGKVVQVF